MSFPDTLIRATDLHARLASGQPLVLLDCSFDLMDTGAGERAYAAGHLPGACYAHLERDLSGPKSAQGPAKGGRHPLPEREAFAERVGRWGIRPGVAVVAYDAQGGMYAARAWWLLRWIGHTEVAVLDGGLPAWVAAGGALDGGASACQETGPYPLNGDAMPTVGAQALLASLGQVCVIDARAPERYRGDVEPLDTQAGHIPGARNLFFKDNLGADGCFLSTAQLHARFASLGTPPTLVVHQCGSGVTACHNLLAMEHAGLKGSTLYPGSWSEWSADPERPVARS